MDKDILNTIPQSNGVKDEIIIVVDRSGSMSSICEDAQGGINNFISEQKEVEGGANLTLVEFDTEYDVVHNRADIQSVSDYLLVPRGMTALNDAIGTAINTVKDPEGKVIVVIVTDGGENSSREYTGSDVKDLIEAKTADGWEFVFLAANQDAIKTGGSLGIDAARSVNYVADAEGAQFAYAAASTLTKGLRTKSKLAADADLKKVIDDYNKLDTE